MTLIVLRYRHNNFESKSKKCAGVQPGGAEEYAHLRCSGDIRHTAQRLQTRWMKQHQQVWCWVLLFYRYSLRVGRSRTLAERKELLRGPACTQSPR